jgi:magnesium transporter
MVESNEQQTNIQQRLEILSAALDSGTAEQVRHLLASLHPAEIGDLLESLPHGPREFLWELVDAEDKGEALVEVNEEVRAGLIEEMETEQLVAITEGLDTDDLADLLQDLPGAVIHELLYSMDKQNRQRLEAVLSYPEDTAGGLMDLDIVTVRANVSLDVVLRYLRLRGEIPDLTDSLMVVDRFDRYQGVLPLSTLLTSDPDSSVAEVMQHEVEGIAATMEDVEVARLFQDRDLVSAPVVDDDGKLLGRITIDDVVDVIREEADHSFMSMAGLDEEDDIFAPAVLSARRRAIWLGVNLATAFLASWVIGLYENTLEKVVALAVLMPIVASMGGIAGSQTLTIMIRGLALGQVGPANARTLMTKEIAVSIMNGLVWSLVVALIATAWFQNLEIGAIIAAALIINLVCAALAGFSIPLALKRIGIDPALAGTVLLTTITDVVGFMAFLGLGTWYLL